METIRIKETHIEPQKLDKVIRAGVPSGFEIRTEAHRYASSIDLSELYCAKMVNVDRAYKKHRYAWRREPFYRSQQR